MLLDRSFQNYDPVFEQPAEYVVTAFAFAGVFYYYWYKWHNTIILARRFQIVNHRKIRPCHFLCRPAARDPSIIMTDYPSFVSILDVTIKKIS